MSKRLQVMLSDAEMEQIRRWAREEQLSVTEWARRALREARPRRCVRDVETKLAAIREATKFAFPTADIDQMLREIEHDPDE
jgi:hypothetical protein